jgi:hypothetical protein
MHASVVNSHVTRLGFHCNSGTPSGVTYQRGNTFIMMILEKEMVTKLTKFELVDTVNDDKSTTYHYGPMTEITLEDIQ